MRQLVLAMAVALAFASLPSIGAAKPAHHKAGPPQGFTPAAQRVLNQARSASGGDGWSMLRGWHETGHLGGVAYEAWFDPLRYGMRVETQDAAGKRVHGFNGQGDWRILPDGQSVPDDDPAHVASTRAQAFFGAAGYFHRARFDAHGELVGVRTAKGRSFDVVMVKPYGGDARDLWFDRRTHLLARAVDRTGPRPVTEEFSDYRRVGPVMVAFLITTDAGGAPVQRRLDSVVFATSDRALFSLPRTVDTPAPPRV
jgi:hypothetical protein